MQSSRRKRERSENDDQGGSASRHKQKLESNESTGAQREFGAEGKNEESAAEVSPHIVETMNATGQAPPLQDAISTEGTNGGNDQSEATTIGHAAMDTSDADGRQEQRSLWQGTGKGTREEQISALITHRKILLERMKQCKVAADTRIKRNAEQPKDGTKAADDTVSSDDKKQGEGQASSDSEEIERYRKICRVALDANKKQTASEKRSSVSLRRGSSVGKRMAAAIPSLGPESSSLAPEDVNAIMAASATFSSSQTLPLPNSTSQQAPPNSKQAALYAAQQRSQPAKSRSSGGSSALPYSGQQPQRKRSASTSRASLKSYQGSSSSTQAQASSSLPLHAGGGTSGLPFNRLAYPTVNFPEARALREKRDGIRTKLNALIHERLERIQQTSNASNSDASGDDQLKSFASLAEKPTPEEYRLALPRMVLERGVNSPSKLPRRQKTHWDFLLEEMRWLATDFVEERKWKTASARTLASAVVSNRLNAVAPIERSSEDGNAPEEDSAEKKKGPASDDKEAGAEVSAELLEEMGVRKYSCPGSSDTLVAQSAAHIMSDMIAEVWTGTIDCGLLSNSDEPLLSALARHNKRREAIERGEERVDSNSADTKHAESALAGAEEDKENGASSTNADELEKSSAANGQQEGANEEVRLAPISHDEITEMISASTDRVKSRPSIRKRAKGSKEPVTLSADQRKAAEFVEFVWGGDDSVAACLEGPDVSGKTVLSCFLMWKRRSEGPQLLVCSPSTLIRWSYELERFDDLNLYVFGLRCGLSSAIPEAKSCSEFDASDIVICDFSSLVRLEEGTSETKLDLSSFSTVVMDTRFPTEYLAETLENDSAITSTNGVKISRTSTADHLIPPELISHRWWATLLDSLRSCTAQRLLIDNFKCSFLSENGGLDRSGLSERQQMDTLAAMAAFVVGPSMFRCTESRSVQHRVVSWAKHSAKDGDPRKRPLYGEVRGVIADAALPFRHTVDIEGDNGADKFEARLCSLSSSQRKAYEECCVGVRGALAFGSITDYAEDHQTPESYQHAIQGLMKLRRACVHSQIDDMLSRWSAAAPRLMKVQSSPSQPQADIASDILCGSAKLRELVLILRDDCGFNVTEDAVLASCELGPEKKTKKKASKKTTKKKVAILAMLPEVQLLVSILLNALGIQHEILGLPPFLPGDECGTSKVVAYGSHSDSRFARNLDSAMAWIASQLSLLRFNSTPPANVDAVGSDESNVAHGRTSCEIVIASPVLVGADNGGLGVEAADLIICLDEDWSGRDSALVERLSKRCLFAHDMNNAVNGKKKSGGCSFIRLVCERTCEQVFLTDFGTEHTARKWPTDERGLLSLPATMNDADVIQVVDKVQEPEDSVEGQFRFPAASVLRFRGIVLSAVLLPMNNIPPDFATGDSIRFLPFQEWEDTSTGKNLSISLARSLIAEEGRAVRATWIPERAADPSPLSSLEGIAIPPFPADFPSAVTTRHDMMAAASRLYVDRAGKRQVLMGGPGLPSDSIAGRLTGPPAAISRDNGHLVDSWQKSGLSCKPGDVVPSLLTYSVDNVPQPTEQTSVGGSQTLKQIASEKGKALDVGHKSEPAKQGAQTTGLRSNLTEARKNIFSASYSSSREVVSNVVRDGNQGFEPLVYFPPLFPDLLEASDLAQADVARRRSLSGSRMSRVENGIMPSTLTVQGKRKEPPVAYPVNVASKRPRFGKAAAMVEPPSSVPPQRSLPEATQLNRAITPSRSFPPMDASVVTEDEASQWDPSSFLFDMGEDYGLLGVGALSSVGAAAKPASTTAVDVLGYSRWTDPYEPNGLDDSIFSSSVTCDAEEVAAYVRGEKDDSFLDTMLLFVAKRAPTAFSGMSAASSFQGANSAWLPSRAAVPGLPAGLGCGPDGVPKKGKRKSQTQTGMPVGAFARVNPTADFSGRSTNPYGGPSAMHSSKGRESYRSKILSSILARQGGGRASLFQVPSFLLASIRIRDDVLRRVLLQSQPLSTGRPVSYSGRRTWTRACYKLSSSSTKQTGDSALKASKNQQIKMLTAPAPVDFGPFVAGYISSPYAACGVVPRGATTGISLPMGVKIPRRSGERQIQGWTEVEDEKLKECVLRYGLNWHLVASSVSKVDDKVAHADTTKDVLIVPTQSRSPGQCHERWNRLGQLDPDLLGALRSAERTRHEKAVSKPVVSELESEYSVRRLVQTSATEKPLVSNAEDFLSLILPSDMFVEKDGDQVMSGGVKEKQPEAKQVGRKKSFAALRSASKKRIEITLPIPGSSDGEKPSLVASHPSHAQAVQAAVAVTSGGKSDMWPLQILDLEDKNRAARAAGAPIPPVAAQLRSPARQPSSNRQQPRHAGFQVPPMQSPSRNPAGHHQPYPTANGAPIRGPPPSGSKSRSTK